MIHVLTFLALFDNTRVVSFLFLWEFGVLSNYNHKITVSLLFYLSIYYRLAIVLFRLNVIKFNCVL